MVDSTYIEGPRFSPITSDDQAGAIWIAMLILVVYAALALFVRLYIKSSVIDNDDRTITAATIFHAGAVIALSVSLRKGLGKKSFLIEGDDYNGMNRGVFANNLLYLFGMAFSKASVVFLFLRLFARNIKWMFYSCWTTIGVIALWLVSSIIALSAGCSQDATVEVAPNSSATCPNIKARWTYIMVFSIVIEAILLLLPSFLIMRLQMKMSRRVPIFLAFAFRLPVIAFAAVHLKLVYDWVGSSNPAYSITLAIIWAHVELCWSLLSASIPNFKTFMRSFSMGFGIDIGVLTTMHGTQDNAGMGTHNFRSRQTVSGDNDMLGTRAAAEAEKGGPLNHGLDLSSSPTSQGQNSGILRQVDIEWQVEDRKTEMS